MTSVDWTIVAIVAISLLLGIWRGFMREIFSLAGWVAAVFLSVRYAAPFGALLPGGIEWPVLRTSIAVAIIVVLCLFTAALLGWVVHKFLTAARLSGTDRMLGGVFGLARAVLIVFIAVHFASRTSFAQQPAWREALLVKP